MDSFSEFQSLLRWEGDGMVGEVPEETDVNVSRQEAWITFLFMPGNTKGGDSRGSVFFIIGVAEIAVKKRTIRDWATIDTKVIFIFGDRANAFRYPNINDGIAYHTSIATSQRGSERMGMINIEITFRSLDHKPWFVIWNNRASMMEGCNVKTASL